MKFTYRARFVRLEAKPNGTSVKFNRWEAVKSRQ